jgi:hypothetical protein
VIERGGAFHGLLIKAYNGVEDEIGNELEVLRRGYRLIKGAGPEEPPLQPVDDAKKGEAKDGGKKEEEGAKMSLVEPDPWPETGPKREGDTVTFPTWNVSWTLPKDGPWRIARVSDDESTGKRVGMIVAARLPAYKPEKPPEGEPETEGVDPTCEVHLVTHKADVGMLPEKLLEIDKILAGIAKNTFDKVNIGDRRVEKDAPIGNIRGAGMQNRGMKNEKVRIHRFYVAHMKGIHYQVEVFLDGDKHADKVFNEPLKVLMSGIKVLDTAENVRGPWVIEGVPHSVLPHDPVKTANEIRLGFKFKAPKDVHEVDVKKDHGQPGLQLSVEAWAPDGKTYVFTDVIARKESTKAESLMTPESIVQQRKSTWETEATDPVTITKGKSAHFDGSYAGAKGVGYRFTGTFRGVAVVEKGFVVRGKNHLYWVRQQFIGPDAEKTMAPVAKSIEKAIKLDK